jgi:tryptophan-rich sensory protein
MRWISLLFWFVLCFAVAGVGGTFTAAEIPGWYRTLVRPSIAPPNWVFGPMWTALYAMMAVAAWRAWIAPASSLRTAGLILFVVQLALNFAWSFIFFREHAIGLALVEVMVHGAVLGLGHVCEYFERRLLAAQLDPVPHRNTTYRG